jgi:RNA-directed DNA polymerase
MSREVHVRFCERGGVRFPSATHLIITGRSKEMLENEVKPLIVKFLGKRGLELSPEKTSITHIDQGFDFL